MTIAEQLKTASSDAAVRTLVHDAVKEASKHVDKDHVGFWSQIIATVYVLYYKMRGEADKTAKIWPNLPLRDCNDLARQHGLTVWRDTGDATNDLDREVNALRDAGVFSCGFMGKGGRTLYPGGAITSSSNKLAKLEGEVAEFLRPAPAAKGKGKPAVSRFAT